MIYFVSDVHLGLSYGDNSDRRERLFVDWLDSIENDCEELFLVGDVFDFWFEWNSVVPKGYVRVLGQLAKMADKGVKLHFFVGNHDKWAKGYFKDEFNCEVYLNERVLERNGVKFLILHGDGKGKSDLFGRALSGLFNSKTARWIFQRFIHPDSAMRFGKWWSRGNRDKRGNVGHKFRGKNEPMSVWAKQQVETRYKDEGIDYVIVGHLHTPVVFQINQNCKLAVLGEWIESRVYGVMDGREFKLKTFDNV